MKRAALPVALLLFTWEAAACAICVSKPLKFSFQDSELFFVGRVTSRQMSGVTFAVQEQFLGDPMTEVTLSTASSCSISEFEPGATYLVEATDNHHGQLEAYCGSHTQRVTADTNRDLQVVRRRARW